MEEPNRYLNALQLKLMPRLHRETQSLRREFPELTLQCWGYAYGPRDERQGFSCGIASADHYLTIDIVNVRFLPCVTARLQSGAGGLFLGRGFYDQPLGSLKRLPDLLSGFRYVLTNRDPDPSHHVFGRGEPRPNPVAKCSAVEHAVCEGALKYLRETRALHAVSVDGRAVAEPKEPDWVEAAQPFLEKDLPGLNLTTLANFHQERDNAILEALHGAEGFLPQDIRPEMVWREFYCRYPDAAGKLSLSRPGLSEDGNQALLLATFEMSESGPTNSSPQTRRRYRVGDPFSLLLLLKRADAAWCVTSERDQQLPMPLGIEESLRTKRLRAWFSEPAKAQCLGLHSICLEAVRMLHSRAEWDGRYDMLLVRDGESRCVSLLHAGWLSSRSHEGVYVVERPAVILNQLSPSTAMSALVRFVEQWETEDSSPGA